MSNMESLQRHPRSVPSDGLTFAPLHLVASNLRAVSSTKCRRDFASLEKSLVALRAHEVHTSLAISFVLPSDAIWGRHESLPAEYSLHTGECDLRKSTGCCRNLDDPSSSVQGSSSGEIRSCTPFPGNELGEFVYAAADSAAAAVK
jgi:hypothetical protein